METKADAKLLTLGSGLKWILTASLRCQTLPSRKRLFAMIITKDKQGSAGTSDILFSFPLDMYPEVGLLDHMAVPVLIF